MKKILMISFLFVIATFLMAGSVNATLIGINLQTPDITSDATGSYSYNSTTDLLTFSATPLTITFDGMNLIPITSATYVANFYVDSAGNFSGNAAGDDLTITGTFTYGGNTYSGTLLTGEITNFGWQDISGPYALFDYTFNVTGGLLASYFLNGIGGNFTSVDISNFIGDWTVDHDGTKTKHDTAPLSVPEPGTLLLLGSGIVGIGFFARYRRRK